MKNAIIPQVESALESATTVPDIALCVDLLAEIHTKRGLRTLIAYMTRNPHAQCVEVARYVDSRLRSVIKADSCPSLGNDNDTSTSISARWRLWYDAAGKRMTEELDPTDAQD